MNANDNYDACHFTDSANSSAARLDFESERATKQPHYPFDYPWHHSVTFTRASVLFVFARSERKVTAVSSTERRISDSEFVTS